MFTSNEKLFFNSILWRKKNRPFFGSIICFEKGKIVSESIICLKIVENIFDSFFVLKIVFSSSFSFSLKIVVLLLLFIYSIKWMIIHNFFLFQKWFVSFIEFVFGPKKGIPSEIGLLRISLAFLEKFKKKNLFKNTGIFVFIPKKIIEYRNLEIWKHFTKFNLIWLRHLFLIFIVSQLGIESIQFVCIIGKISIQNVCDLCAICIARSTNMSHVWLVSTGKWSFQVSNDLYLQRTIGLNCMTKNKEAKQMANDWDTNDSIDFFFFKFSQWYEDFQNCQWFYLVFFSIKVSILNN